MVSAGCKLVLGAEPPNGDDSGAELSDVQRKQQIHLVLRVLQIGLKRDRPSTPPPTL